MGGGGGVRLSGYVATVGMHKFWKEGYPLENDHLEDRNGNDNNIKMDVRNSHGAYGP